MLPSCLSCLTVQTIEYEKGEEVVGGGGGWGGKWEEIRIDKNILFKIQW